MPAGVEAVGRLVEDQDAGVAEQRVGDAEPLPHAERVVLHASLRLARRQRDELEHLVDARHGQPHRGGPDDEHLAAGATRVLRRRVQQHADVAPRVGDGGVRVSADRHPSPAGRRQPDHDPHGGRLAGSVRSQEPGHSARLRHERHVVDGLVAAVVLGHPVNGDHVPTLPVAGAPRTSVVCPGAAAIAKQADLEQPGEG
jgi:hypothetical protein